MTSTDVIHTGDSMDVLDDLDENSVHAVVTDPPYGLAFMGRSWDDFEPKEYQEFCERWASKALRVLKPGGHLLAFSGNRTHHRLFSGVEDAGFKIRDTVTWHYGSGFPKALDVSKAIDKKGARTVSGIGPVIKEAREDRGLSTRDVAEHFADDGQEPTGCVWNWENGASKPTVENFNKLIDILDLPFEPISPGEREVVAESEQEAMTGDVYGDNDMEGGFDITVPATDAAAEWDGWKTTLKPATEFVVVARAPLSEGTVAENVQTHGTGALNIDGTRVGTERPPTKQDKSKFTDWKETDGVERSDSLNADTDTEKGRYPSNVVFDETQAHALDEEVGDVSYNETTNYAEGTAGDGAWYGGDRGEGSERPAYGDTGGPSRYFYTSKATKAERTLDGRIDNAHPTVKPADLMEWLVRLVTAEGQVVLDPFAGSGTTCRAAKDLGREFVGIEKDPKWADVARVRCGLTAETPAHVRPGTDDGQTGMEAFTDD